MIFMKLLMPKIFLGNIKTELERYEEAEQHYLKALQLREELEDQWELANAYLQYGQY